MILGMNPRELRKTRPWYVYLWPKKRHWALVLQPQGAPFQARIADDFVHNAMHCYNAEVSSAHLFLVYEMLAESEPFLMLSVKPDFDPYDELVHPLGMVVPATFEDLEQCAIAVIKRYRRYSLIGCNCQHFVTEFAASIGVPGVEKLLPDDEAFVQSAEDASKAVCTTSAIVAVTASTGAMGTSMVATALPVGPLVLKSVAAAATTVGLIGSLSLLGVAFGYRAFKDVVRQDPEGTLSTNRSPHHPSILFIASPFDTKMPSAHSTVIIACHELSPRGYGGRIKDGRQMQALTDEPESEAAPACDKDLVPRLCPPSTEEPGSECKQDELREAMAAGGSRVAPWCSATSWEQPVWMQQIPNSKITKWD